MENLEHGEKKELAKWLGVKKPYLSRVLRGDLRPSKNRALELEKRSGISFKDWLTLPAVKLKNTIFKAWQKQNNE